MSRYDISTESSTIKIKKTKLRIQYYLSNIENWAVDSHRSWERELCCCGFWLRLLYLYFLMGFGFGLVFFIHSGLELVLGLIFFWAELLIGFWARPDKSRFAKWGLWAYLIHSSARVVGKKHTHTHNSKEDKLIKRKN